MTGRAVPGASDDPRLVEALRTGDVIALSEVYDAFAPPLFDYCHGLLRDRVEAAGALRGCLFAAREHVTALREPERLRGWLYAIARKESLRRRDDPSRSTGQEAPEAGADEMSRQERGRLLERRELAHAALGALDGRQRELLDLAVRHGLPAPDLGKIFGLSPAEADAALADARAGLTDGLRAALVTRRHSRDCPELGAMLPKSWPPAPPEARTLSAHVASCRICSAHEVPDGPADQVLGYMPVAAIPADLRLDLLNGAASPGRAEARRSAAALVEPLDSDGWPTPYRPSRRQKRGRRGRANEPMQAAPAMPAWEASADPTWDDSPRPADAPAGSHADSYSAPGQDDHTRHSGPDVLAGPGGSAPSSLPENGDVSALGNPLAAHGHSPVPGTGGGFAPSDPNAATGVGEGSAPGAPLAGHASNGGPGMGEGFAPGDPRAGNGQHASGGIPGASGQAAPGGNGQHAPGGLAGATAAADGPSGSAPDTTLTFDVVPGTDETGRSGSRGRGSSGGGRHSRDADDGDVLKPTRSGRIPEDGDRWVAGEMRAARGRKRALLAGTGGVAAVALIGVAAAAFAGGGGGSGHVAKGGEPVSPKPSGSVVEPSMSAAGTPSGSPTLRAKKTPSPSKSPTETPSTSVSPTRSPAPPPSHSHQPPRPPRPGTLSVAGCAIGYGDGCTVTITATGGSVTWRVVGVSDGLSASGGGTLAAGQSARIQVSREAMCWGSRTGQVAFSPSGTAVVTYC
ncbi:hypothetical protein [Actinomadura rupiterrae]|uniref:hypothetical protein n=1 Tax=Actinomadura rupiterrae TaxID=559627 RepID=UPI0020A48EA7|nr:hypothetical protein [Actinomadura rupiterrae]MCP2334684.1 DNA-directed RNA polymerase specialized sigma24 family protein [Actinomadura rupiterrae]